MKVAAHLSLIVVVFAAPIVSQDVKGPQPAQPGKPAPGVNPGLDPRHDNKDPWRCKRCYPAIAAAKRHIMSKGVGGFTETIACGWAGLADPANFGSYVQRAIATSQGARAGGAYNGNFFPALGACFLAECVKRGKVGAGALQGVFADAARNQEPTGGWHHHKGFNQPGYSKDLGILTVNFYSAMMSLKAYGYAIPEDLAKSAEENIWKIRGPSGIGYGVGNEGWDPSGSRAAYVFMGLHELDPKVRNNQLYEHVKKCVPQQHATADKGHACSSLHWPAIAIASWYMGPDVYNKFASIWVDKLIDKQQADGGVYCGDDGVGGGEPKTIGNVVGSTAAFCLVLTLQQDDLPHFDTQKMRRAKEEAKRKKMEEERKRQEEERKKKREEQERKRKEALEKKKKEAEEKKKQQQRK